MKAFILHESQGRIRFKLNMPRMTIAQADIIEEWFKRQRHIQSVTVHERTCCVILKYSCSRTDITQLIAGFDLAEAENLITVSGSSRALRRSFEEKLIIKCVKKILWDMFMPYGLRAFRIAVKSLGYIFRAARCLCRRQFKVDILDGTSIGLSVFRRDFSTAGAVMFLLEISELLEEWTRRKAMSDLANSMSLNVSKVWLKTDGGEVLTPISEIAPKDLIVLRSGGIVPLDGIVHRGEMTVNQASLTGEHVPVVKREGGALYAGTVIEEGECVMSVTSCAGNSRYDRIVKMIEESEQLKSSTESKALELADKLVPYTFVVSFLGFLLTGNITKAVAVLMIDFSCALKLAMPLSVLSAMRDAGRNHITVKGGKFLEKVAAADTVVFDKTGTLTHACPKVAKVVALSGRDETEMLRLAACLEEHFPHSIANAVVAKAKEEGITHDEFHSKVEYQVAHGIRSSVDGKTVLIGSAHFVFEDEQCTISPYDKDTVENLPPEYSHLYLAVDGQLAAVICIFDPLRQEAAEVLSALRPFGITKTVMLTGDNYRTAKVIAENVGVDCFQAEVLPSDKAEYVARLKNKGHTVIMVGDGINDSPALSRADVGIAIDDGAAIAREVADITITAETLWELVCLKEISLKLSKRIAFNYRFIIGFNGCLIAGGLLGLISPASSALLHNLSTMGISLKSISPMKLETSAHIEKRDK